MTLHIIPLTYLQVRIIMIIFKLYSVCFILQSFKILDGELYTATVSDFSGSDPLIYKEPLRTEQYDSKILNSKWKKNMITNLRIGYSIKKE